jgi:RecA-family ATPase
LNIYGKPKTGKSMIGLQLASAISSGKADWLSFGIVSHGPVAYLQIDTPRSLWMERVKHLQSHGLDFSNVYFADSQECPYPFNILGDGKKWLQDNIALMDTPPLVLFIDTLREIHSGSEDESAQMKNVLAELESAVPGMAIVLISHSRKGNPQNFGMAADLMDENRGSGYIAGRMDCVMWLREKALTAKGRSLPETEVQVDMHPESYEIILTDQFVQDALNIVQTGSKVGIDVPAMIEALHSRYPKKSIDACRGTIRRISPATV